MSHSSDADQFIVDEWKAALADAHVSDAEYHLIVCAGSATDGWPKAVSWDRDLVLDGDESEGGIVVGQERLDEANRHKHLHRVATFEDWDEDDQVDLAMLAGLLRHEIEHGRQRDGCPRAFALYDLTDAVIELATDDEHEQRALFHTQPVEWDANAAASMYLRQHLVHRAAVSDLLAGRDRFLVRSTLPPSEPQVLVARTVAFLHGLREATLKQALIEGTPVEAVLDDLVPGAGGLWHALEQSALC